MAQLVSIKQKNLGLSLGWLGDLLTQLGLARNWNLAALLTPTQPQSAEKFQPKHFSGKLIAENLTLCPVQMAHWEIDPLIWSHPLATQQCNYCCCIKRNSDPQFSLSYTRQQPVSVALQTRQSSSKVSLRQATLKVSFVNRNTRHTTWCDNIPSFFVSLPTKLRISG